MKKYALSLLYAFKKIFDAANDVALICFLAGIATICNILVMAAIHQWTGSVPSVNDLNLLVVVWHLPFAVSRLWDCLMAPVFVGFLMVVSVRMDDEGWNVPRRGFSRCLVYAIWPSVVAYAGGNILGMPYALPIFVASYVTLFLSVMLFRLMRGFIRRLGKRMQTARMVPFD